MEEQIKKIRDYLISLEKAHKLQRYQLELGLESTVRDSRYSQGLQDLMNREDIILGKSCGNDSISQKIEDTLVNETKSFFRDVAQQNIKKWIGLLQKFDKERQTCSSMLLEIGSPAPATEPTEVPPVTTRAPLTAADLEKESIRLEQHYNEHWLDYEGYSIREAMSSQLAKIECDWREHEIALSKEFESRRLTVVRNAQRSGLQINVEDVLANKMQEVTLLLPTLFDRSTSETGTASSSPKQFQPAEKTKSLVHTVPVLSPDDKTVQKLFGDKSPQSQRSSTSSAHRPKTSSPAGSGIRAVRQARESQLARSLVDARHSGSFTNSSSGSPSRTHTRPATAKSPLELKVRAELKRVDEDLLTAQASFRAQKESALKWMRRQGLRLLAQAEVVDSERKAIGALIRRERVDFDEFFKRIENL